MCGIVGIINCDNTPVSPKILQDMTEEIHHRGPDDTGYYVHHNIGLGHARLAIIDLSHSAHQPMISEDGNYIICFNGEIYNYQSIKKKLKDKGILFRSQSDTEVLLYAYIEWGEEILQELNGMFVFTIYDNIKQKLFIARDRYGIKPLYYYHTEKIFVFASEIKSILKHPSYNIAIDKKALVEYFTFQNFFSNKTLFEHISILNPGSFICLHMDRDYKITRKKYWDFNFVCDTSLLSEEYYYHELERLLIQAVKRQLVSDVEIGSYLSGGIDSGLISSIASRSLPFIKTFTCGFDLHSASGLELSFDEREKAEFMSYLFHTEHYEIVLKSGDMERIFPDFVNYLEEPRVGQSYPNYYVAKLASKFVKVVLSGTGSDELFGGYPWRYFCPESDISFNDYISHYYTYWQRLVPTHLMRNLFTPIWAEISDVDTKFIFKSVFKEKSQILEKPEDYINLSLYFEAKTFLHGLLIVEDKLSMANGLEMRVPFLDNDLVDFAMKLPLKYKLKSFQHNFRIDENSIGVKSEEFFKRTNDGKTLLRNVAYNFIGGKISDASKQGFSAPDASWFKGDSIDYVRTILFSGKARIFSLLDKDTVLNIVQEHFDGKKNHRLFIWSILYVEWWLRTYLP